MSPDTVTCTKTTYLAIAYCLSLVPNKDLGTGALLVLALCQIMNSSL